MKKEIDFFMNKRVLFIEEKCSLCNKWREIIQRYNKNILDDKKIEIINLSEEKNKTKNNILIENYKKYIDDLPCLFFEGIKVSRENELKRLEIMLKFAKNLMGLTF